jgi:hypothetical protein
MYGYHGYHFYASYHANDQDNCLVSKYVHRSFQCFIGNDGCWTDFDEISYDLNL